MLTKKLITIALLLLIALSFTATNAQAKNSASEVNLLELTEKLSKKLKKPVILPQGFNDTLYVSGSKQSDLNLSFFKQILRNNGYAALETKEAISVVSLSQTKTRALPLVGKDGKTFDPNDLVTATIQVKHIDSQQLLSVIRTIVPTQGHFTVFRPKNSLIIVDFWDNVQRIQSLVATLDKPLTKEDLARSKRKKQD